MKSIISKQTEEYIKRLEQEEKKGKPLTPYHANPDAIDQLIIENNLEIVGLNFYPQIDLMLIVLNNKKVLKESISKFKLLRGATKEQLERYRISRTGVHWEELDEDLSLRGFLKSAVSSSMSPVEKVA